MKPTHLLLLALLPATALAQKPAKIKLKSKIPGQQEAAGGGRLMPTPQRVPDYAAQYAARYVTQERLRRDLTVLASDEYEGRETGTKGQKMAATYISEQFKQDGLTPPLPGSSSGSPFWQSFELERSTWQPGGTLTVGGKAYKWLEDFYAFGRSPFQQATQVQPVFVGYGIEQGSYSDYRGVDVQGKDLLVLLGEPRVDGKTQLSADGTPTKWSVDFRAKATLAAQKGARSVFFVSQDANFAKTEARLAPRVMQPTIAAAETGNGRAPSFFVSPALGLKLLGMTPAQLATFERNDGLELLARQPTGDGPRPIVSIRSTPGTNKSSIKPAGFTITAPQTREAVSTENVLGYLPGTDLPDEIVVVSAHYDHLGIIGGQVYNGADDDGSGTVGVLALAEAFAKAAQEGHGPRRSLLFLANTGEEKGLLGSEYYVEHPVYPLDRTVADLNIDMIGRTDPAHAGKPDYVYVIGSDKLSSQLHAALLQVNEQRGPLDLDFRFNNPEDPNRFYYRSDHYNFAKKGIPVAFFFSGVHADYHEASDEVSKIEFGKLEARARLVFYLTWELANRDERPRVDSNKP